MFVKVTSTTISSARRDGFPILVRALHCKESSFQTLLKVCAAQSGKKDGKVEEKDGDEKWI